MNATLRFLLALFTILCCATTGSAGLPDSSEGVVLGKTCVLEGGIGVSADFNAPNSTVRSLGPGAAHIDDFSRTVTNINPGKYDYLFGRAGGNAHNIARTNQNALQMKRLGVPDTNRGHAMLSRHFDDVVQDGSNITSTYSNKWGNFEIRESLFPGPGGGFAKFESTWEVMSNGTRRLTTVIPFGR